MASHAQEPTYGKVALDARGFALPKGADKMHLWAISGFHIAGVTTISVMSTCFDSTIWVGRCTASEVVNQLAEDLGAVLSEESLLEFLQEALTNQPTNHQPSQPPQPFYPQSQPPPQQQPSQQLQQPSQPQSQSQGPQLHRQPSQLQLQLPQPPSLQQHPALTLLLPRPRSAAADDDKNGKPAAPRAGGAAAGRHADGGDDDNDAERRAAFVTVALPPSRFDGCEVTVRLPTTSDLVRLCGSEAQTACLTLVANLIQQVDEQRYDNDHLVLELERAGKENQALRAQLAADGDGGSAEGLTLKEQYGLAGAPPPPTGAAAKRQRSGGVGSVTAGGLLQMHLRMQQQQQETAAAVAAAGGAARSFSQPLFRSQLTTPLLAPPLTGGSGPLSLQAPSQGGASGSASGGGDGAVDGMLARFSGQCATAVAAAPPPLVPGRPSASQLPPSADRRGPKPPDEAILAAGLDQGGARSGHSSAVAVVRAATVAAAAGEEVDGRVAAAAAEAAAGLSVSVTAVAPPPPPSGSAARSAGDGVSGSTGSLGSAASLLASKQFGPSGQQQSQQQQQQQVADGDGVDGLGPPAQQRDPSRVGITIRKIGAVGRGLLTRGGRSWSRR